MKPEVSHQMMERYSHNRQQAKRAALDSVGLDSIGKVQPLPALGEQYAEGYDTNHDTNTHLSEEVPAYAIEGMVGTRRLELLTSTVSR